ncbi:MAG: hypothetical protein KZQ93_05745 [Candidatus Thiodiazotropha sp. (ex Monitilora ramsayi)]|nr:hypothetical protein [Candidatus Thiodiazotropha sp. (ex Monitilora ramsayi)]
MNGNKDKNTDIEKVIKDDTFRDSFNKEITSNTSETSGDIPEFTTGDGDSSGGDNSNDSDSSE